MATAQKTAERTCRLRLDISGVVQGVGFRPFVCRLADNLGLSGHVFNSDKGVCIEVEGKRPQLKNFEHRLKEGAPPRARIDFVTISEIQS